ncbi:MAP/microtubule affinity-regulating kinase 3-like [Coccinella septempunctata]|uniref:MAP/microtubule affinity-regulating kinase 3-like n=1 Tax=Coccinella septempunctata TaxID=41139 RepID=UPI001D099D53|nr:MAP/microtubule affinity-regulating kinase 3-like [Coccinella septempunctata]
MNAQAMAKRKIASVGNYKFTGKILGKGNFARVEEAYHELLGIKVAVKIMDLNNIKEEYVVRNLFREAKIMSKLKHPCIVSLFETMQKSDNVYYLVTEVVTGGDLCTYVKAQRNGKLEERTAKYFGQQFVSAIAYMHQRGIVHRDLKMENVMLNSSQTQIKIVDFGLSNEWSPDSPLKTHCGSPEYAAPELFVTSKVYGPEVDLWSFGIILYGMVVGQLPFVSNKSPSISSQERRKLLVAQINKGIAGPQRKAIASFSTEFKNLMNRLLNADSKKRIDIKEMIVHPWITENGRKIVKTNPLRKIATSTYNRMLHDISTICGLHSSEIPRIIDKNPFGTVGAMLNILIHRTLIKPFTPDSLTKFVADSSASKVLKSFEKQRTESPLRVLQSARFQEDKLNERIPRPHTTSNSNISRTRTVLTRKSPHLSPHLSNNVREDSSASKSLRPRSVQFSKTAEVKEVKRPATSALHKRQEYSATLASRFVQQASSKCIKPKNSAYDEELTPKKHLELSRKCESPITTKIIRVSDSNIPKRIPRTPTSTKRRSSIERSKNIKSSSATEAQKNPYGNNLPHIYALMKLVAPHAESRKKSGIEPKTSARSGSNKSAVMRHSGIPIMPRSTPARTKLRSSRPSCTNIENTVSYARRLR